MGEIVLRVNGKEKYISERAAQVLWLKAYGLGEKPCLTVCPEDGWICSRETGHEGAHVAHHMKYAVAVWLRSDR